MLYRSSGRDFEACSQLHELAPCNFVQLQPVCDVDPTSDLLFSSDVESWSFEWSAALCANPLNNHNFVIFRCTAYAKTPLERSFFYLNVDALFARIGPEATELWLFEGEHFILFGHADAFDRRRSPFFLVVAIGTRLLSNPVAAIDKGRKSIVLAKDWVF